MRIRAPLRESVPRPSLEVSPHSQNPPAADDADRRARAIL